VESRHRRRRSTSTRTIQQTLGHDPSSGSWNEPDFRRQPTRSRPAPTAALSLTAPSSGHRGPVRTIACASLRSRRSSSAVRSGSSCGRRRAYASDATGRAEWRFCCSSQAGALDLTSRHTRSPLGTKGAGSRFDTRAVLRAGLWKLHARCRRPVREKCGRQVAYETPVQALGPMASSLPRRIAPLSCLRHEHRPARSAVRLVGASRPVPRQGLAA
jgi:hypothetical protein